MWHSLNGALIRIQSVKMCGVSWLLLVTTKTVELSVQYDRSNRVGEGQKVRLGRMSRIAWEQVYYYCLSMALGESGFLPCLW